MRKYNKHLTESLVFFNGVGFHLCFSYCLRLVLSKSTRISVKIIAVNSML